MKYFGTKLENWTEEEGGWFDFIRLFLAIMVLYFHCYHLAKPSGGSRIDIFSLAMRNQTSPGVMAVDGFFVISGFLITMSWLRSVRGELGSFPIGCINFLFKRVLRILPGMVAASFLCVYVVGWIGAADPREYLNSIDNLLAIRNAFTLKQITGAPPTFPDLDFPSLNGSLWTIRIEFECYLLLPLLALLGILKRRALVLAIALVAWGAMVAYFAKPNWASLSWLPDSRYEHVRFVTYFLSGMALYLYRDRVRISFWLLVVAVGILCFAAVAGGLKALLPLVGPYILIICCFAPRPKFTNFYRGIDLSYGTYLYAWPVKLLILHFVGSDMNPDALFIIALPLVLLVAMFSWYVVEKPCLSLKSRLLVRERKSSPVVARSHKVQ